MKPLILFPIDVTNVIVETSTNREDESNYNNSRQKFIINYNSESLSSNLFNNSPLKIYPIYFNFSTQSNKTHLNSKNCQNNIELEDLKGSVLSNIIKKKELSFLEKLIILINTSEALEIFHEMNIIHGNLRPDFILMDLEYGIKFLNNKSENIYKSFNIETTKNDPSYIAPELFFFGRKSNKIDEVPDYQNKRSDITNKIDIWAFGCIIKEVISGFKPWSESKNNDEIIDHLLFSKKFNIPSEIPLNLRNLIDKCTSKEPISRPSIKEVKLTLYSILFQYLNELIKEKEFGNNIPKVMLLIFENYKQLNPKSIFWLFNQTMIHLAKYARILNENIKLSDKKSIMSLLEKSIFINQPEDLDKLNLNKSNSIENNINPNNNRPILKTNSTLKITLEDNSTKIYTKGVSCLKKESDKKCKNVCLVLKENDLITKGKQRLKSPARPSISLPNEKNFKKKLSIKIEYMKNNFCEGNRLITKDGEYNLKRFKISLIRPNKLEDYSKIEVSNEMNFNYIEDLDKKCKNILLSSCNYEYFELLNVNKNIIDKGKKRKKKKKNIEEVLKNLVIVSVYSFNITSENSDSKILIAQTTEEINLNSSKNNIQNLSNNINTVQSYNKVLNNKIYLIAQDKIDTEFDKQDNLYPDKSSSKKDEIDKDPSMIKQKNICADKEKLTNLYFNSHRIKTPKRNISEFAQKNSEFKYKKDSNHNKKLVFNSSMKGLVYNFFKYDKEKLREILKNEAKSYSRKKVSKT